jgi:hypothetical protein
MPKAKPTGKRGRRAVRRVPIKRRRLPAKPLPEAIDTYAKQRRQPVEELLDDGLQDRLRDAARSGTVTVGSAARCCDALGWHPRMLWGDLYDQAITDDIPHIAAAPPGTATAWRQGCRCLDCRDANTRRAKARRGRGHQRDPPRKARTPDRRNARLEEHTDGKRQLYRPGRQPDR